MFNKILLFKFFDQILDSYSPDHSNNYVDSMVVMIGIDIDFNFILFNVGNNLLYLQIY